MDANRRQLQWYWANDPDQHHLIEPKHHWLACETLHVARAKGSLVKDTDHVATCLTRHGAKADYLHQRGGVIWWGNWIADIVTNSRRHSKVAGEKVSMIFLMTSWCILRITMPELRIVYYAMCIVSSGDWHYERATWYRLGPACASFEWFCLFRLICTAFMSKLGGFLGIWKVMPLIQTDSLGKIDFLMNFSKHSNLRLSKTTESFQTNFNLCLVSFDCAIRGRLGRGREPTTSPRERRNGEEEMSWQWVHIRLLRSADQNVWMVPLAGSCFRILHLTGWSRFSIVPSTRALLLNTSLNNDEFIFTLQVFWAPCFASRNWKPTNSSFSSKGKVTSRSCSSAGCSCTLQDGCSGCLISMDFSMLNFDLAMLILVQSGRPVSSYDKSMHENNCEQHR